MEAIRQAGGTEKFKFHSAAEQRKRAKKQKREERKEKGEAVDEDGDNTATAGDSAGVGDSGSKSAGGGGDLMADLMKALALRRKGISGKASGVDESLKSTQPSALKSPGPLGSALAKMSDMIPPPPTDGTEAVKKGAGRGHGDADEEGWEE